MAQLPRLAQLVPMQGWCLQASSQGFWDSAEGQQAAASEARHRPGNGGSLRTKHTRKSQTSGRTGSGALVAAAGENSVQAALRQGRQLPSCLQTQVSAAAMLSTATVNRIRASCYLADCCCHCRLLQSSHHSCLQLGRMLPYKPCML